MKYLTKIIEYGLYLLVFLLPIQTRWIIKAGETEYATYSLYGTDVLLITLLLLFLFVIASDRRERSNLTDVGDKLKLFFLIKQGVREIAKPVPSEARDPRSLTLLAMTIKNKLQIPKFFVFGLLVISFISVFFAIDKALAFYKLGWLVLGLGLFWLVVSVNYDRLKLLYASLAGIFLQSSLAGWQFLTQSNFASKWLGLAWHDGTDLGASVVETVGADGVGERWLRSYGGFDHPNMLGGLLAIGILLLMRQIIITKQVNNFQFSIFNFQTIFNFKNFKIIGWLSLIVFFIALFFSFSRTAWLALAAALTAALGGAVRNKNLLAQKNILQAVLISGLVFFILFFQFSNLVLTRLYAGERLEIKSVNERAESLKNSWLIIKNNWSNGVGLGNYVLALEGELPNRESFSYQPAHNVYLLVLSETGLFGFIFFVGLIVYLTITNNGGANSVIINRSILVALIVMMALDHWLWSLHFGVLFFWLILGLIAGEERKKISPAGGALSLPG